MDNMLCSENVTLLDVLRTINLNTKGIAFLTNSKNQVSGVLTDGDIRTLLLENVSLSEIASKYMNRAFVYGNVSEHYNDLLKKMNQRIKIIPILDSEKKYKTYFEYNPQLFIPVANPELIGNEFKYVVDAFLSTWISSSGRYIKLFEEKFAEFCGTKYAIAVSNGTSALHLSLLALGICEGDEVIIPDLTFAATINTILYTNAIPVIVDIERDSWCIDPVEIEKAITPKTRAIIPVHLYGQPANMNTIMNIARKHNLFVIEDAAEAHGAEFGNKKVGSIGDIGCFSFYGNKVITTGEGGMCVTNSEELAKKIRLLKDHGMSTTKRYWHDVIGYNYRMTNLQASIGYAQIERIDSILENRRKVEENYKSELKEIKSITWQLNNLPERKKITWLVSCLIPEEKREKVIETLKQVGIDTRPFFYSLGDMEIYKKYVFSNSVSKEISAKGINFPTMNVVHGEIFFILKTILKAVL